MTYREKTVESLEAENEELRKKLRDTEQALKLKEQTIKAKTDELHKKLVRKLTDADYLYQPIYQRSSFTAECRMCNVLHYLKGQEGKEPKDKVRAVTCTMNFEPATKVSWLGKLFGKKPFPARMRRDCIHCKAVYYELPGDKEPE